MMWAPNNGGDPYQMIGMSLDEGFVCYLVGEKKIEEGGKKKEAVGTATIRATIG